MQITRLWRNRLRTLSHWWAYALSSLGVLVVGSLLWIAITLNDVGEQLMTRNLLSRHLATAQIQLLDYQRLSNLAVLVDDPAARSTRARMGREIEGTLAAALASVTTAEERAQFEQAAAAIDRYIAKRRSLEALDLPLDEVVSGVRPELDAANADLRSLRNEHLERVTAIRETAERATMLAATTAGTLAVLTTFALLVSLLGVRRYLLFPILRLRRAIERFEEGEGDATADESGPVEIADIARAFNDMRRALELRRRRQLAYVGGVAHDIRNPLGALRSGLELLVGTPTELSGAAIPRLQRQIELLARLANDLTDTAGIESGVLTLECQRFDLRQRLSDLVDLYRPVALDHPIELVVPPDPVFVWADPGRLEQVIVNLLTNALKYSKGGTIRICLRETGGRAEIDVKDEGDGIPSGELPQLFQPFRRRRDSTRVGGPGAGLGLSIVRKILRAHGGDIGVVSQPGCGSTFTAWFPVDGTTPNPCGEPDADYVAASAS